MYELTAVVGVESADLKRKLRQHRIQRRRQPSFADLRDAGHHLPLRDLIYRVDVIHPFDAIPVPLVDGVHPKISGASFRLRAAPLSDRHCCRFRLGEGGLACAVGRCLPQAIQVGDGDTGQLFELRFAVFAELTFQDLPCGRSAHCVVGLLDRGQMGRVDPRVEGRETMPAVGGGVDRAGGGIFTDEPGDLRPAVAGHFRHVGPQQTLALPALLGVVMLPQCLACPLVNLFPAVSGKAHLLACFQQRPDLLQAQLLATLHADDQSPACTSLTPSGSSCVRIARSLRLILHEIRLQLDNQLRHGIIAIMFENCFSPATFQELITLPEIDTLTSLDLSDCVGLKDLTILRKLKNLTTLTLVGRKITDFTELANLTALTSLTLTHCEKLTDLSPISGLRSLATLSLAHNENVSDISHLSRLTALETLDLSGCGVSDIGPLATLQNLRVLTVDPGLKVRDLSPLSNLPSLTTLDLRVNTKDLGPLAVIRSLRELTWFGGFMKAPADLSPLSGMVGLSALSLRSFPKNVNVEPLASLVNLKELRIISFANLSDVEPLKNLVSLKILELNSCTALEDLTPLASLSSLEELSLTACSAISNIEPLGELKGLHKLDLSLCENLSNIRPIAGLPSLIDLDLSDCQSLQDISSLAGHSSVVQLKADAELLKSIGRSSIISE